MPGRKRTYFNTSRDLRPNQLPNVVENRLHQLERSDSSMYRVVDYYIDMHKIPAEERIFGMIVTVVNDPIVALNKTYILLDTSKKRNFSDNKNWEVFSNSINEILGENGQYFENAMELTIVHGLNRWPIQYVLIDEEGSEIFGRVKFINNNMFRVEFDLEPVTGYMFYYI